MEIEQLLLGSALKHYGNAVTPRLPALLREQPVDMLARELSLLQSATSSPTSAPAGSPSTTTCCSSSAHAREEEGQGVAAALRDFCSASSRLRVLPPGTIPADLLPHNAALRSRLEFKPRFVVEVATPHDWKGRRDFDAAAAQFGTVRACHGSAAHNWFGILHCGLRNLSGTNVPVRSLFGEGAYLTTSLLVAHSFSGFGASLFGGCTLVDPSAFCVVGIFDVALDPTGVKTEDAAEQPTPKTYIIAQKPALVQLRYLLFYGDPPPLPVAAGGGKGSPGNGQGGRRKSGSESRVLPKMPLGTFPRRLLVAAIVGALMAAVVWLAVNSAMFEGVFARHKRLRGGVRWAS